MAQRYGGKFSRDPSEADVTAPEAPTVAASFRGRSPARYGARINILFLMPIIALFSSFFKPVGTLVTDMAGAAILLLAAWLLRDGVRAEDAYNERKVARRPGIPRKVFASIATGLGVAALIYGGQWNGLTAAIMGVIAAGLHSFAFGIDPMRDKGLEGVDHFQTDRVARKIEEAEELLSGMSDAIKRAGDRQLEGRVESFQRTARDMFRTVEEDPRDLTQARKYLGVYLKGARDATVKFADLYGRNKDASVRADYVALLDDLETNFATRTRAMLVTDRSDLDVEIDVLRDRLNRDNLHIDV